MKHWTNARPNGIYLVENLIIVEKRSQRSKKENKTIHKTIKEFFIKSVIGYKVAQNVVNEQEISQNGYLD